MPPAAAGGVVPTGNVVEAPDHVFAVASGLRDVPWGTPPGEGASRLALDSSSTATRGGQVVFLVPVGLVTCTGWFADLYDQALRECWSYPARPGSTLSVRHGFAVPAELLGLVRLDGEVELYIVELAWLSAHGLPLLLPQDIRRARSLAPLSRFLDDVVRDLMTGAIDSRVGRSEASFSGSETVTFELAVRGRIELAVRGRLLLARDTRRAIPWLGTAGGSSMHVMPMVDGAPSIWLDPALVARIADHRLTSVLLETAR
jgi:hypothetical protein